MQQKYVLYCITVTHSAYDIITGVGKEERHLVREEIMFLNQTYILREQDNKWKEVYYEFGWEQDQMEVGR